MEKQDSLCMFSCSVLGMVALFNLILSAMMLVGIPVIVVQILGMSDTAFGIPQGAMGLGELVGGVIAGAAILVMAVSLYSKKGFAVLKKDPDVKSNTFIKI